MKEFNVRLDEIDDLFSRLYEFCEDHHYFTVKNNLVEVFEKMDAHSAKLAATIKLVDIVDGYDIVKELSRQS